MKPLVSILIPAYNASAWIAETIKSALAQSWPRKEIIVIDDGSTDDTFAIARQFSSHGVTVLTQPNLGAAATRNKLFSLSRGDYVQWLDADDLLSSDKITRQMKAAELCRSKRTLYCSAWGSFLSRTSSATFKPSPLWRDLTPTEWLTRKLEGAWESDCYMQTATWLVTRELTEAAGPWDSRLLGDDDGEYFCRVKLQSDEIKFVPTARVYYRMSGHSSLSYVGRSHRKLEAQFLSMQLHIRYLRSLEDSPRTREACIKYLQKYMTYFYMERNDIVEQMQCLANELGGTLEIPRVRRKYAWLQNLFGWRAAKHAQDTLPAIKWLFLRTWDRAIYKLRLPMPWRQEELGSHIETPSLH